MTTKVTYIMTEIRRAFAIILVFVILFFWFGLAVATEVDSRAISETNSNNEILFDVFLGKKELENIHFCLLPVLMA